MYRGCFSVVLEDNRRGVFLDARVSNRGKISFRDIARAAADIDKQIEQTRVMIAVSR